MHDDPNATAGQASESGQDAKAEHARDLPAPLERAQVGALFDLMARAFQAGHGLAVDIIVAALAGTSGRGGPSPDAIGWATGKLGEVLKGGASSHQQHPPLFVGMPPRYQDPD